MKFSVVVIGFNQREEILRAIDSVLLSSYRDMEVIFVDDASTDDSVSLVQGHYDDPRLQVLRHDENQGPFISRLDGIARASGDYVLLLDGDDSLAPGALEILSQQLEAMPEKPELLGFGAELIYTGEVPEPTKQDLESLLNTPCLGALTGMELAKKSMLRREMSYVVWNKCYSRELLMRASGELVRDVLMYNEDFYFSFVVSTMAQSYYGIADRLYLYRFGSGISTAVKLSLGAFQRTLTGEKSSVYCREYAQRKGLYEPFAEKFTRNYEDNLLGAYYKLEKLDRHTQAEGARLLLDTFGAEYALSVLEHYLWDRSKEMGRYIPAGELFPVQREKIKTVAMFYNRLYNGGVERVIGLLSGIFSNMGYRVLVVTNEPVSETDYPLPDEVIRLSIGEPTDGEHFADRGRQWSKLIAEYGVDAVVYHDWLADWLFWDLCAIKRSGAAFITYAHSIFTGGLPGGWNGIYRSRYALQHADMMLTLTNADRLYWCRFCKRVKTITNPLTFRVEDIPQAPLEEHNILWMARFGDPDKNPLDALDIMPYVVSVIPDAKLYMVGQLEPWRRESFEQTIAEMGLQEHIILPGYSANVQEYYQKASVHLMTTNYEGYGMTLTESMANGVPVVTYEMPYLTRIRNSQAVVQVPWRNIQAAAAAVVELLQQDERRKAMGAAGRIEVSEYEQYDFAETWTGIFRQVLSSVPESPARMSEDFMELTSAYDLAVVQMCATIEQLKKQAEGANPSLSSLLKRKLRNLLQILQEQGPMAVMRRLAEKLRGHLGS